MAPDHEELSAWLRLLETEGVGAVTARALLVHFGLPQQIFASGFSALCKVVPEALARALLAPPGERVTALTDKTLQWCGEAGNHILTLGDAAYPPALLDSADPPALLYAKGNIDLLQRPALAMVGSRNATVQGMQDAQGFARTLAEAGITIVSGLAQGIDTAAHLGALEAEGVQAGSTIAVIGTGADIVYPARNRTLAHRIAAAGLLLSEYPLGTPAIASNFPRRNRIISGLSRGVMVVEAAALSGSLITARLANELGRDVFAIPGSIHSPLSRGCHQLIKQGAKLVESAEDVLEELRPSQATPRRAGAAPATHAAVALEPGLQALLDVMGHDPVEVNVLAERAGLDAASVAAQLLALEMQAVVEALPGARYRRLS
ncbi:MAG: smf [Paucimonas sp.]|nr:smf [Paucimonas sp.]